MVNTKEGVAQERFRLLFKTMRQGVIYQDKAGRVVAMNPAAKRILGRTPEDFLGKTSLDMEHHTLREDGLLFPGIKHPSMVALQTGQEVWDVVMGVYNPREKAYRWINISAVPLLRPGEDMPYQVYIIFDDITGRRKNEAALKASELSLKQAQRLASVGSWEWDVQNDHHVWSDEIFRIYGRDPALPPAVYPGVKQFFTPESWARLSAAVEKCRTKGVSYECDAEVVRPDGGHRWIIARGAAVRDAAECICKLQGTVQDITERKKMEEALRQSEAKFARAFANNPAAIALTRLEDGKFLEVNNTWEAVNGYSREEVIGRSARKLGIWPAAGDANRFVRELRENGVIRGWEQEFRKKSGEMYVTELAAQLLNFDGEEVVLSSLVDVTARKKAEQLLQHTNRTLQVIRDCHEVMLRARSEHELLANICRIVVQSGGGRMAWVGFAEDNARKTVHPVAATGGENYLATAHISWADTPRGRGPVGTAIRTRQVCLCHDTFTDPGFAPWRASARRNGFGSVIALPLLIDNRCLGALCIYAQKPGAFDPAEQQLLTALANDLAYGIGTLRLRAERERLEKEILKSVEREQERIGRDLHDGICQMLVGAKFKSGYLGKIIGGKHPEVLQETKSLEKVLNQAVEQTRNLARGLNPVKPAPDGLELALQKLAAGIEDSRGPHCFCRFAKPVRVADHGVASQLYRIAQEAVQNAVKHAAAKNISISLVRENRHLILAVKDDGRGIPSRLKKSGMGLDNMQTRAALLGGTLEIRRRKHGGTSVTCTLPATSRSAL